MSFDLILARFDGDGDETPKHADVLADMFRSARGVVPEESLIFPPEGTKFEIELDEGTGTVEAARAIFQLQSLGPSTLHLIYEVAKAGDMAVIMDGAACPVILTAPDQRRNLPTDWIPSEQAVPVASTAAHLGQLLGDAFQEHDAYRQKVAELYQQEPRRLPRSTLWKPSNPNWRVVYLQARRGERAMTQMRRLQRFYGSVFLPQRMGVPMDGSSGGYDWVIELPSGERFYSHATCGDHEGWMNSFKSFAAVDGRLIGTIDDRGDRFTCSDDRSFPLSECTCRPLTNDD